MSWPNHTYPYEHIPSPQFWVKVTRLENDEEYSKRIAEEEEYKKNRELREQEEFARLSAKYGTKETK